MNAVNETESMDRHDRNYLSFMGFQLRAHLVPIIGLSELLIDEIKNNGSTDSLGQVEDVNRNAKKVFEMISGLYDLSCLEAGILNLFPEDFSFDNVFDRAIESTQPLLDERGV